MSWENIWYNLYKQVFNIKIKLQFLKHLYQTNMFRVAMCFYSILKYITSILRCIVLFYAIFILQEKKMEAFGVYTFSNCYPIIELHLNILLLINQIMWKKSFS